MENSFSSFEVYLVEKKKCGAEKQSPKTYKPNTAEMNAKYSVVF